MNEEPGFADEVVVIFGDGKGSVLSGLLPSNILRLLWLQVHCLGIEIRNLTMLHTRITQNVKDSF